jgi:Immunity protein 12
MEITISGRMGGPEHLELVQPMLIAVRKELKLEFSKLRVEELSCLDLTAYFNGSVMSYFPEGGVQSSKYKRSKKEVSVELSFLKSDIESLSRHQLLDRARARFLECVDATANALGKHQFSMQTAAMVGAINVAFDRLVDK